MFSGNWLDKLEKHNKEVRKSKGYKVLIAVIWTIIATGALIIIALKMLLE